MKKKLFSAFAAILVLVISIATLVACNPYKNTAIGGGDATAPVESNGGYIVKQGNYVYFVNGYVGADADATWGAATKQGIVRAEVKEDGTIDNSTSKLLVPKSVYNSSVNGGIAIFGEWIYYATPNVDKDKSGTASTTDTDFMRTKNRRLRDSAHRNYRHSFFRIYLHVFQSFVFHEQHRELHRLLGHEDQQEYRQRTRRNQRHVA